MKKIFFFTYQLVFVFLLTACLESKPTQASKEEWGTVELVITPYAGDKPLHLDSVYTSSGGQKYSLKSLRFFLSDIAFARSTGKENRIESNNQNGIFLVDFNKAKQQNCKISFKAKEGDYSDVRFTIGLPRELNHGDPAVAPEPLNIAQGAEMYWEWNSGYIFFLAEGKIHNEENPLFHFAIGNDSRIMPLSFGNLFEIAPLIQIQKGKTTEVKFSLDVNKLLINGDQTNYSFGSKESRLVHGGFYADVLRTNLLNSFSFRSSKIKED